ncbi:Chromosomal replication initiator protein DnaA [Anatilimnocola aggregata]|uniref:Chromosomal replication initiator protein DnaA n=2 Tax=Anatilimnocola aggregata TaxID=2528021 RepID=A0A517YL65_9BACT|nr:Chromosomal replication initiator protein DnaA [Anatilimnocola aggregata]
MEIVSAVQSALLGKVGENRFRMWATEGVTWRANGPQLSLLAHNTFRLERLRRLRADVLAAAQQVLGAQATVDMKVCEANVATADSTAVSRSTQPMNVSPTMPAATLSSPLLSAAATSSAGLSQPGPQVAPVLAPQANESANPLPVIFRLPSVAPSGNNGSSSNPAAAPSDPPPANRMTRRTFAALDSFVVGEGNRLAHAAINNLLSQLGRYSPLFISGPPGCGKTHLLEGAWRAARQTAPNRRTIYLSAEQFTTQFVEALRGSGLPSFRRKYRDVELLLIDDLQFFMGKQSTLVELQHTVDTLLRSGRQIVFAADRTLGELKNLGSELVHRISGGLVCAIDAADMQTRLGVLEQMASRHSTPTPRTVLEWLSTQLDGDARQLAGALNRLHATSEALHCRIDLPFAQRALADLVRVNRRAVRLTDITSTICDMFGIDEQSLQSESKSPAVSHPRMLAMWLARKYTRAALSEIGKHFNRKSHTTVISAEDKVSQWLISGKSLLLPEGDCRLEDVVKRVENQLRLA